ncbi:hypothetical protein BGZ94_004653 [Podila epigama]|nr:hypothetical protein BGZ94_004653 [Podila epigama]
MLVVDDILPIYSRADPFAEASAPTLATPAEEPIYVAHEYRPSSLAKPLVTPIRHQDAPPHGPQSPIHPAEQPTQYGAITRRSTNEEQDPLLPSRSSPPSITSSRKRAKRPKRLSCSKKYIFLLLLLVIYLAWWMCKNVTAGNVIVKESDDWKDDTLKIHYIWQASNARLFDAIYNALDSQTVDAKRTITFDFFLKAGSTEEKKRLLRQGCARVDTEIIYPRAKPGTGRLDVQIAHGTIQMQFDKVLNNPMPSFDVLMLTSLLGDVHLENVPVLNHTKIDAMDGHVYGSIRTSGKLDVFMSEGPIDLAVQPLNTTDHDQSNLDIQFISIRNSISLDVPSSFYGHFNLSTTVGQATLTARDRDTIYYTTKISNETVGWVSRDAREPTRALPRIALQSFIGNLDMKIA